MLINNYYNSKIIFLSKKIERIIICPNFLYIVHVIKTYIKSKMGF